MKGSSPYQRYQQALAEPGFSHDPEQERAATALDQLYQQLISKNTASRRWLPWNKTRPVKGLYLWGGVGRGKTWLMDLFYESLPQEGKIRLHFHRFMQRVHAELRSRQQGRNPLAQIAADWARQCQLLCFDEFFVTDIADAMLMAGLLETLFKHGTTLVATSNVAPDSLYQDGLQRAKFLPAIELIKAHTDVLEIQGGTDFRLRILEQAEIYHWPQDATASRQLRQYFNRISPGTSTAHASIKINDRDIAYVDRGDGIIWFEFDQLCEQPRNADDYIEIARSFNTVILANTPHMDDHSNDPARRFIALVDEFYDRNVKLILSAEVSIDELYSGERLQFEFTRTRSRLTEMQTREYLARPHLA